MDIELFKKYHPLSLDAGKYKNYQSTKDFFYYAESILDEPFVIKDNWHDHVIRDQVHILSHLINACPSNKRDKWLEVMLTKMSYLLQKQYATYLKSNDKTKLIGKILSIRQLSGIIRYINNDIKSSYPKLLQYEDLYKQIVIPAFVLLEQDKIKKKFNKIEADLSTKYKIQLFKLNEE